MSKIRFSWPQLSELQANACVCVWISTYFGENRFLFMRVCCARTLLGWNVLVERVDVKADFLSPQNLSGWWWTVEDLKNFTLDSRVVELFVSPPSPHLVVPSTLSYLPCLLFFFLSFISLGAFLLLCGQVLVFSTQIGNIPCMDPSSAPFHLHYWACFVC